MNIVEVCCCEIDKMASVRRMLWLTMSRSIALFSSSYMRPVIRKKSTGLVHLGSRRLLQVVGEDKQTFLQGLVTSDLTALQSVQYAMLLNPQGRVLYETLLYKEVPGHPDLWLLECCAKVERDLVKHLRRYILRVQVQVKPCDEYSVSWILNLDKSHDDHVIMTAADPRVGALGTRVITRSETTSEEQVCSNSSEDEYTVHRLRVGVAEGSEEVPVADCFPLEYNLEYLNGVSFDKGCYVGQELTARTHHTGVVRKRVVPITFGDEGCDTTLPAGSTVYNDKGRRAGKVVAKKGAVGLGLIRLETQGPLFAVESTSEKKLPIAYTRPLWWPTNQ